MMVAVGHICSSNAATGLGLIVWIGFGAVSTVDKNSAWDDTIVGATRCAKAYVTGFRYSHE